MFSGCKVNVVNHGLGDRLTVSATDKFITNIDLSTAAESEYNWTQISTLNHDALQISHSKVSAVIVLITEPPSSRTPLFIMPLYHHLIF